MRLGPSQFFLAALAFVLLSGPQPSIAQVVGRPTAVAPISPAPAAAPVPTAPRKKLPPPQNIGLKTRDGVQLAATFYPSPLDRESQKDAVPVIMLHGYKGSRADFNDLALALQAAGCAVLVPDLRCHGESTRRLLPDGSERKLELAQLAKLDLEAMVNFDVEACKTYLKDKNNAKELNIEKLCVVGADMGAAVAVNWAAFDWHWPVLPALKQGQDVKALVLLSPPLAFKGLPVNTALSNRDFSTKLAWMIVVGAESKEVADAKRIYQLMEKFFPADPVSKAALVLEPVKTSLQGTKLLATKPVSEDILKFIDAQVGKKPYAWAERKSGI